VHLFVSNNSKDIQVMVGSWCKSKGHEVPQWCSNKKQNNKADRKRGITDNSAAKEHCPNLLGLPSTIPVKNISTIQSGTAEKKARLDTSASASGNIHQQQDVKQQLGEWAPGSFFQNSYQNPFQNPTLNQFTPNALQHVGPDNVPAAVPPPPQIHGLRSESFPIPPVTQPPSQDNVLDDITLKDHFIQYQMRLGRPKNVIDDMMTTWRIVGHNETTLRNLCRDKLPANQNELKLLLMKELNGIHRVPDSHSITDLIDATCEYFLPSEEHLRPPLKHDDPPPRMASAPPQQMGPPLFHSMQGSHPVMGMSHGLHASSPAGVPGYPPQMASNPQMMGIPPNNHRGSYRETSYGLDSDRSHIGMNARRNINDGQDVSNWHGDRNRDQQWDARNQLTENNQMNSRHHQQSTGGQQPPTVRDPSGAPGQHGGLPAARSSNSPLYVNAQQLFVGNLPHNCTKQDLEELFNQFGKVAEIRINDKGADMSNSTRQRKRVTRVPNFGFVVFEEERSVQDCLGKRPIKLYGNHRLNVEKKTL
jgi:hypothetical protein